MRLSCESGHDEVKWELVPDGDRCWFCGEKGKHTNYGGATNPDRHEVGKDELLGLPSDWAPA